MAIMPSALLVTQEATTTDHNERSITPDSGIPHTLALIKLGSWLLGKEKIVTVVPIIEITNPLRNDLENELESLNTVQKLRFSSPPVDSPPAALVALTEGNR